MIAQIYINHLDNYYCCCCVLGVKYHHANILDEERQQHITNSNIAIIINVLSPPGTLDLILDILSVKPDVILLDTIYIYYFIFLVFIL